MKKSELPVIVDIKEAYDYVTKRHGITGEGWKLLRFGDFVGEGGKSLCVLKIKANGEKLDYYFEIGKKH